MAGLALLAFAVCDDGGGLLEYFHARFAVGDLGEGVQPILERSAVGVLGFAEEFGDLVFEEFHLL